MAITYPGSPPGSATDTFNTPSNPAGTPLSEAGAGNTRNLNQSIGDEGAAITRIQQWAALRTHDHSGDGSSVATGAKLTQSNTHESADTDASTSAVHHTLGTGAHQAAAGNHTHQYASLPGAPYIICTSITRPSDPFFGLMIFETDTSFLRIWASLSGSPGWQLLPVLGVPQCQLIQVFPQVIDPNGSIINWHAIIADTNAFFSQVGNTTDIIIRQAGLYAANLALQWSADTAPASAFLGLLVNNELSTIQQQVSQVGDTLVPGFSQTMQAAGAVRLEVGDVVQGTASYIANTAQGTVNTFVNTAQNLASNIGLSFLGL